MLWEQKVVVPVVVVVMMMMMVMRIANIFGYKKQKSHDEKSPQLFVVVVC